MSSDPKEICQNLGQGAPKSPHPIDQNAVTFGLNVRSLQAEKGFKRA